jgi:hypothetical protein
MALIAHLEGDGTALYVSPGFGVTGSTKRKEQVGQNFRHEFLASRLADDRPEKTLAVYLTLERLERLDLQQGN